mmetsp:Transcript_12335/g.20317  ORF Transcript_12335/g.20317 Transcript_12335/m.20317 type:complete len:298 (-) Transcript_12335:145-1038(-)
MSERNEADATSSCASCGIAQEDDIKLRRCTACYLVKYCSIKCQRDHRPKHKRECKKRAAELRDELLFKQPESSCFGDCPICCLPLSRFEKKSIMYECCSKTICIGCYFANHKRELKLRLVPSCAFCRTPISYSSEERDKRMMKRIEANDPFATFQEGVDQYENGNYEKAFEWYTKAAELGSVDAHFHLACLYHFGHGIEKNEGNKTHHLEEAAISGHPMARRNLGLHDKNNGNMERAVKHFIIAATLGLDDAIKALMQAFKRGHVSKEDLAAALRAHQDAVDETKSPLRELAGKGLS